MRFALTEEQETFRDAVHDLLAAECPPEVVRAAWPAQPGGARPGQGSGAGARAGTERLQRLSGELAAMGVLGLLVPEAAGGLGLDEVAAAVVWEETGYAAVPFGIVETMAVAAPVLAGAGSDRAEPLVAMLAGGTPPVVVPHRDPIAMDYATNDECRTEIAGLVPWVDPSGRFDVIAFAPAEWPKDEGKREGEGSRGAVRRGGEPLRVLLGAVDAGMARPVASVDGARHLASVRCDAFEVLEGLDGRLAERRAVLGAAAQLVGLAQRMLDLTVAYVIERRQYGVPIGSFQAVKHQLADVRLQLEFTRPAVLGAAWALATGQPTAAREVSMAKALASDCASLAARTALQCHGAIGHTVEYDLHLFVKRAWALAAAWGDAAHHRDAVAAELGL